MQVKTLQGIPFLVEPTTKKIYAYEKQPTEPLWLGTFDAEAQTYQLRPDWQQAYQPVLEAYRSSIKPHSRLPGAAPQATK